METAVTINERDAFLWRKDREDLVTMLTQLNELADLDEYSGWSKRDLIADILRYEYGNEEVGRLYS